MHDQRAYSILSDGVHAGAVPTREEEHIPDSQGDEEYDASPFDGLQEAEGEGPECKLGIAKNVTLFDPANRWSPIDWPVSRLLEWLWNGAWRRAITRGSMLGSRIPDARDPRLRRSELLHPLHHWSVLAYIHRRVILREEENEVGTEFGYPMYAEGMRRAIDSSLNWRSRLR